MTLVTGLIVTFVVFLLVMTFMAVGWLLQKKEIKGSCGGINITIVDGEEKCGLCGSKVSDSCRQKK